MRARHLFVVPSVSAVLLLVPAPAAFAHVEAEATPARALAANAQISMLAEAESTTAGITGVRVQLPGGLVPGDFSIAAGPKGWRAAGSGQVLEVRGPALAPREDLKLTLRVRQLPETRQLVLKTILSYAGGRNDPWIELPTAQDPEPENPAPTVTLAAAAPGATPMPRASAAPSAAPTTPAPTTGAPTATAAPTTSSAGTPSASPPAESSSTGRSALLWLGGAGVVGLLTGGVIAWRRRRA